MPNTDHVTIVARNVIHCADPQKLKTLPSPFKLGPLDYVAFAALPIDLVWVYESSAPSKKLVPVSRLRAIGVMLNYYPQLTGRLSIDSLNGIRTIIQLGTGILFLEALCDVPLSSFRNPNTGELDMYNLPGSGKALIAPWDPSTEGVARDPPFTAQHTRFACGSVAVGIRISHVLCAAEGALCLFQNLAQIYREMAKNEAQAVSLQNPPSIIPWMADETTGMTPEAKTAALSRPPPNFTAAHVTDTLAAEIQAAVLGATEAGANSKLTTSPAPKITGCTLRFSTAELTAIKAAATPPDNSTWVSTFEALAAHLWQSAHKARLKDALSRGLIHPPAQPISFITSINFSSRLSDTGLLLPRYFPNAIVPCAHTLPSSTLASEPLWRIAQHVHAWIRAVDTADASDLAAWIAAQENKTGIVYSVPCDEWSFCVSAWHGFPLYNGAELDEGVRPVLAGFPFAEISLIDGMGIVTQAREGVDRGVEVKFTVAEPVMRVMEEEGGEEVEYGGRWEEWGGN
ncbi:hypothetical protein N0V88_004323 [Collariella sp. IMI 366227]|nr:hypothetical protein N0V88_004323 [Collariella sp. IMI 366227]